MIIKVMFTLHCKSIRGFPGGSDSKESACNAGDKDSACNAGDVGSISASEDHQEDDPTPVFLPGQSHGKRSLTGLQSIRLQRVRHIVY